MSDDRNRVDGDPAFRAGDTTRAERTFSDGQVLGDRYRIVRWLGAGGMGEVYEALDNRGGVAVALKTVRNSGRGQSNLHARLRRELLLTRRLSHPNVCRVFDLDQHGLPGAEIPFFTMELLRGETLAQFLTREGAMPPESVLATARAIADAVTLAHRHGIIHRDLKPGNIFLEKGGRIVVTDFGVARGPDEDSDGLRTRTGEIIGTPKYTAPDVLQGNTPSAASDVYSFGVLVHEMLTGCHPVDAAALGDDIPVHWRLAIARSMSARPQDRFQSPNDVVAALEAAPVPVPVSRRSAVAMLLAVICFGLTGVLRSDTVASAEDTSVSGRAPVVLLADIENRTRNPQYDFVVTQFLAVAMEQSPYLNVLSRNRISELSVARTRDALVNAGGKIGANYVVSGTIEGTNPNDFRLVIRVNNLRSKREQTLTRNLAAAVEPALISELAAELREVLGEPRSQIQNYNVRVDQATTRSELAWQRFSQAMQMDSQDKRDNDTKLSLLQSAVEIDSEFAAAWGYLGAMQNNSGNPVAGLASVSRAFELRDRTTEREKYRIAGQYHSLRYEYEKQTEAFRQLTILYPFDEEGQRFYAQSLGSRLLTADSVRAAQVAVDLNASAMNIATLVNSLTQNGQGADALNLLDRLRRTGNRLPESMELSGGLAMIEAGRYADAEKTFQRLIETGSDQLTNDARQGLSTALLIQGKRREAQATMESALGFSQRNSDLRQWFKLNNWLAWTDVQDGRHQRAAERGNAISPELAAPANLRELRGMAIVMIDEGQADVADRIYRKVEEFAARYQSNLFPGVLHQLRGETARKRGDYVTAGREFTEAMRLWPDALILWSAARAAFESGDFQRAADMYREVLSRRGEIIRFYFPGLIPLAESGRTQAEALLKNPKP